MFNIALAVGFAIASLLSPGKRILALVIDGPVLQSLPAYQGHLLMAFASYLVPAVLTFLLLRFVHAERWLRTRPAIHALLGIGNALLILYVTVRTFASMIQGGGPSFVVLQFAPFFIFPAWTLLTVGLIWLAIRSIRGRKEESEIVPRSWSSTETLGVVLVMGIPTAAISWTLFLSGDAPFRQAREAEQMFRQRCVTAGEKIYEHPQNVQSIYLDRDGGQYFDSITNGIYGGYGGGIFGEGFVNNGLLMYIEKPNDRQRVDGSTAKYRRHVPKDWKGEPVEELTSEYGVFQKSLATDQETKLGLSGTEVTIKNLRNEHIVSSLIFFTSSRHRSICGHAGNGRFSVSDFVRKSLNLTRQVPSPSPQDAMEKNNGGIHETPNPATQRS
jgi:hypothetical protein